MRRADIVCEVAAPGRINPARQAKAIVFDFIHSRSGHHSTDLGLFAKREQVGQNAKMFAAPIPAGDTHAALYLIENKENVVLIAYPPQVSQEFVPEMIISSPPFDR